MKKFLVFLIVLLVTLPLYLHSQNTKVDDIINHCKSVDEKIGEDENSYGSGFWVHTIKFTSNRRAIGLQITTVKFYYEQQGDTLIEKDGSTVFLDIYNPPVKITVDYNIAASQNVKVEYYPDQKGKLIFYHYISKGMYTSGEELFYFENDKPIKIKSSELNSESEVIEKFKNYEKEKNFSKEDLRKCKKIIKNWSDYRKMFDKMIYIEKLDK